MSNYFVELMDAFYDKPYGKSEDQCAMLLEQYMDATKGFEGKVQKEAWERIRITHPKRPPLTDVIKVLNQVHAEQPENRPDAKLILNELMCLRTLQGKKALKEQSGRAFWLACDEQKRIITLEETQELIRQENKAKAEKIDFPLTKFGRFLKSVHGDMGIAEKNFQDKWAEKILNE